MTDEIIIADCETDNLLDAMTKFWCVQIGTSDGDDSVLYGDVEHCDRPLAEGLARMKAARHVVFHNGLGFDYWAINHFYPGTLRFDQVLDSLVLARMTNITERNHSLDAWGRKTGTLKGSFRGPYDVWTKEFADYSRQDIPAGRAVWQAVKHGLEWGRGEVYATEARAAYYCAVMEQTGVVFDVKAAEELHAQLADEVSTMKAQLKTIFPAFSRSEEFIPKINNAKLGYKKGEVFIKRWNDEFNPRSRQMIAEGLQRDGWTPTEFTPTGQPKVDEDTLRTCDHPGAKLLVTYLRTSKVLGAILGEKIGKGYLQLVKPDGRIHGRVNTLGAVSWRASHTNPNTANVDKDERVRKLFGTKPGMTMVGCDAAEIQARFLAHYLHPYDGGEYAEKLLKGDKTLGTDGHSINLAVLKPFGMVSRNGSKTAMYAKTFGCGFPRMFATINEDRVNNGLPALPQSKMKSAGQGALKALGLAVTGFDDLIEDVKAAGKSRGWLRGIGGAQVPVAAAHAALVALLQHGESVALKDAMGEFMFEAAPKNGWRLGVDWAPVLWVHDECEFECHPDIAENVGAEFAACIRRAGERLGVRCPLAGDYRVGANWQCVH